MIMNQKVIFRSDGSQIDIDTSNPYPLTIFRKIFETLAGTSVRDKITGEKRTTTSREVLRLTAELLIEKDCWNNAYFTDELGRFPFSGGGMRLLMLDQETRLVVNNKINDILRPPTEFIKLENPIFNFNTFIRNHTPQQILQEVLNRKLPKNVKKTSYPWWNPRL